MISVQARKFNSSTMSPSSIKKVMWFFTHMVSQKANIIAQIAVSRQLPLVRVEYTLADSRAQRFFMKRHLKLCPGMSRSFYYWTGKQTLKYCIWQLTGKVLKCFIMKQYLLASTSHLTRGISKNKNMYFKLLSSS